jgi:2-dehydropantoate 2-reductase
MSGKQHGVIGYAAQTFGETAVHLGGVAAGKVGAPAPFQKQRVAGHQHAVNQKTLAAGGVTRCVDEFDADLANGDHVTGPMGHQVGLAHTGGALHPRSLVGLDVDGYRHLLKQAGHTLDAMAHHVATNVIGVIVGCQHPGEPHVVSGEHLEYPGGVVRRIHHHRLTGLTVADEVDEVHHLTGNGIVAGDVTAGQQLPEIQSGRRGCGVSVVHGVHTLRCDDVDRNPSKRSYCVIGVGGVGGYYGARLALAGHHVHWVGRSDVAHLDTHGLRVTSPRGDVHLTDLDVSGPDDPLPVTDVVVVATKTIGNDELARWLAERLTGRSSTVVVLQNGLDVERPFARGLAHTAPHAPVLGAMSFICSARTGPGHIEHVDYERVTVGGFTTDGSTVDPGSAVAMAMTEVVEDLGAAGVPCEGLDDLVAGRWRKLVWNVPFNGLSVVLDATTAEMVTDPACRDLVRSLMTEVVDAAAGTGHRLDSGVIEAMFDSTERMVPYDPSMKLDYLARRPLELDAIYAEPVRSAGTAGVPLVRTEALWRQLVFLDHRNRTSG